MRWGAVWGQVRPCFPLHFIRTMRLIEDIVYEYPEKEIAQAVKNQDRRLALIIAGNLARVFDMPEEEIEKAFLYEKAKPSEVEPQLFIRSRRDITKEEVQSLICPPNIYQ